LRMSEVSTDQMMLQRKDRGSAVKRNLEGGSLTDHDICPMSSI